MVKSSFYVKQKPLTRADELREQLNELEAKVGRLGYGLANETLTIPVLFDLIAETMGSFQAEGQEMRAEQARLQAVSADLRRKAAVFLHEIGGANALHEARQKHRPDPANWWWFLDRLLVEKRRLGLRRMARLAAGVIGVLALLAVLYQRFLAPDPATRTRLWHQQAAQDLATQGDLASALTEIEQALAVAPDDAYLLIFKGSLQQGLGQDTEADKAFAAARKILNDPESFLLARGQAYLLLGQATPALADAMAAVEINPGSASGYMLIGHAQEQMENYAEAILAYQQASKLADDQGNYQLAATARVNMAVLMQRQPVQ